jgi:hypothetical protein
VDYASSNTNVAAAPNTVGDKSKVNAVATGTATITATDPVTGITTGVNDDATLTVRAVLESITLSPAGQVTKAVGQFQNYTATGHYADGSTANLTQQVDYMSSNTSVAVAPNTPGNKSKVDAVGVGDAFITATDPTTGVSSGAMANSMHVNP